MPFDLLYYGVEVVVGTSLTSLRGGGTIISSSGVYTFPS
jgi:hypothetical protein